MELDKIRASNTAVAKKVTKKILAMLFGQNEYAVNIFTEDELNELDRIRARNTVVAKKVLAMLEDEAFSESELPLNTIVVVNP
jgi:hypothetical protein